MMPVRANRISQCLIGLLVAASLGLAAPALRAQATDPGVAANAAKLGQLLKQSGYTYKTHSSNTWSIELQRKNMGTVRVITSVGSDLIVTFAMLAKKANIQKTLPFLDTLATANHEYDYAKIGLDKDGDLFVRIDTPSRLIDVKEFKSIVEQVANASDEVYAKVSGSIRH
jgi:hypothetical protein